ncbi:dehydratase [Gemmata sp. G18]|uniref:Dehydratase n=1 Tax=Gemmata palustris TaxID=2822762 RepID=A0ABS5BZL6_9BACT|nr:MaoC/PaaZ C-terminal domain-containing protein [Gemmata palustris]MBP3959088.1 dehydratase [Gemmata palustris]
MSFSSFHLYFDDLEVGQEWTSGGRTVTDADIVNFAGFSGDFNPIHIDHEFAKGTPFRRPIAHGFAVFCIASGLGIIAPPVRTIAMLRVSGWNFSLPVFIGDTIHNVSRVKEKTVRGRGRRGEVLWHRSIINQDGKVVQDGEVITLVECRTPAREAAARESEPTPASNN